MKPPRCPSHGPVVLDLALGRLDDDAAVQAEETLRTCGACSEWWRAHLEGEAATVVDRAVSGAFAGFSAPRRRLLRPWMAAAAMAVFGLTLLWTPDLIRTAPQPPATAAEDTPTAAGMAPAGPSAEAVETSRVLDAVFGSGRSATDAGALARVLGAPQHRDD